MKTFKIPVTWEVYGEVEIEAENIEKALEKFNKNIDDIPLPCDSEYVDGSFKLSHEDDEFLECWEMYQK